MKNHAFFVGKSEKTEHKTQLCIPLSPVFPRDCRERLKFIDEPTSGLDPLMQNVFTELLLEEKKRGKTIFMSSHMMEEVEKTCGRVCILKDGHTVSTEQTETLKAVRKKIYTVTLTDHEAAEAFARKLPVPAQIQGDCVSVKIKNHLQELIRLMNEFEIKDIDIRQMSLEDFFMQFYGGDKNGQ